MTLDAELYRAAVDGDAEEVARLLDAGADANGRIRDQTILMAAVSSEDRDIECVRLLLEHGADVNARTTELCTPLLHAINVRRSDPDSARPIVTMLVQAGADLEACDCYGWTPLRRTIDDCADVELETLLELGADVNACVEDETALMLAISQPKKFRRLLDHGADPHVRNCRGEDIFAYAEYILAEGGCDGEVTKRWDKKWVASIRKSLDILRDHLAQP